MAVVHLASSSSRIRLLVKTALLSACLASGVALAQVFPSLPTMPGATLLGLTGNNTTGYGDVMLPLFGQSTSFFHLNPQGLLNHTGDYTASLGGGFRHLTESAGILGAYVFGDYNRASSGNKYWFVSPGIERLGEVVDIGANVYIPTGQQRRETGVATGEELGRADHVFFERHSHFDSIFRTFESVGTGVDAEVGVRIPVTNNPKLYVGGYYFNPKDNSGSDNRPQGLTARLEVPLTDQLMLVASDGYDNIQRNTFKIGASYNFGGRKTGKNFKGDLTQRLVDPIRRNVIAVSGPSNTAQPVVQDSQLVRENVLIRDHIAFFDENANTGGNGTYERPFNVFNQTTVDEANGGNNRNFYVQNGTYVMGANITVTDNSIFGREDGENGQTFARTAVGNHRPLFEFSLANFNDNAFVVEGNNNVFDSVRLRDTNQNGNGIFMQNLTNENMTFLMNNTDVSNFSRGMLAENFGNTFNLAVNYSNLSNNGILAGATIQNLANGAFNVTAYRSSFNGNSGRGIELQNGIQSGSGSGVFNFVSIGSSVNGNGDVGAGIFNYAGEFNALITHSSFNGNEFDGMAINATLNATTTNVVVSYSTFNGTLSGNGLSLVSGFGSNSIINFISNHSSFDGNNQSGLLVETFDTIGGVINATLNNSTFNGNTQNGLFAVNTNSPGATLNIVSNRSTFNGNTLNGLSVQNDIVGSEIHVEATDSIFGDNGQYGVFGVNTGAPGDVTITLNRPIFLPRNGIDNTNEETSTGITWTIINPFPPSSVAAYLSEVEG